MKSPVCLGDPTRSGGIVIECQLSEAYQIRGRTVAVVGDKATCPLHMGIFEFAEGDPHRRMGGKSVVLDGHRLTCGCEGVAKHATAVSVS